MITLFTQEVMRRFGEKRALRALQGDTNKTVILIENVLGIMSKYCALAFIALATVAIMMYLGTIVVR